MKTVVLEKTDYGSKERVDVGAEGPPSCSAAVAFRYPEVVVDVRATQAHRIELQQALEHYRIDQKRAPMEPEYMGALGVALVVGGGTMVFMESLDDSVRRGAFWTAVGGLVPLTTYFVWVVRDGSKSAPYGHTEDMRVLDVDHNRGPAPELSVRVHDGGVLLGEGLTDERGVARVKLDRVERVDSFNATVEVGEGRCGLDLRRTALTQHLHEEELLGLLASGAEEDLEQARAELTAFGEGAGRAWEAWCALEGRESLAMARAGDWERAGLLSSIPEGHCGSLQSQARQAWRKQLRSALSAYRLDEARELWAYGSGLVDVDESDRIHAEIEAAVPKSWPSRIRRAERVCSAYASEVYTRRQRAYAAQRLGPDELADEVAEFEAWIAEQEAGELGEILRDAQRMMGEMEDHAYRTGADTDALRLELAMTMRSACP